MPSSPKVATEIREAILAHSSWSIADDIGLLELMLADMAGQQSIYQPGPYWLRKSRSAAREIRRCGLANFRGRDNIVGLSCVDKPDIDVRMSLNLGARRVLKWMLEHGGPVAFAFDGQVRQTVRLVDDAIRERAAWIRQSGQVRALLERYRMPYSIGGGCLDYTEIDGVPVANHYLHLLETLDAIHIAADLSSVRTYFEIGGGFGGNVHVLLSNFQNVRKVIYLDIPPNLYIGTAYLRSHFGDAVVDYRELKDRREIRFRDDNELEIFCIAPWQIERLQAGVDHFHNANSMVEMPMEVAANYARQADRLLTDAGSVSLVSYEEFDLRTTFHPDKLPGLFLGQFDRTRHACSAAPHRRYYHYVRRPQTT